MGENEMKIIGSIIADTINNSGNEQVKELSRNRVIDLCRNFKMYENLYI
jgi:glycine/serine hydroxymethyltransferase